MSLPGLNEKILGQVGEINLKRFSKGSKKLCTEVNPNQASHACNKSCKNSSIPSQRNTEKRKVSSK